LSGPGTYVLTGEAGLIRTSPDGVFWTTRTSGTLEDLNGVLFAKNLFIAQGNSGVILTSTNGISWTARSSGTSWGLATSVCGSCYVVVDGQNGTILSSLDGINWSSRPSGSTALLLGFAYGQGPTNGCFVAVGAGGTILQSGSAPNAPTVDHPAMNNGLFTLQFSGVVGPSYVILCSTNLSTWTRLATNTPASLPTTWTDTRTGLPAQQFYRVIFGP
jgi:hypothetical protein